MILRMRVVTVVVVVGPNLLERVVILTQIVGDWTASQPLRAQIRDSQEFISAVRQERNWDPGIDVSPLVARVYG